MITKFQINTFILGENLYPTKLESETGVKLHSHRPPGFDSKRDRISTRGGATYGTEVWIDFDSFETYVTNFCRDLNKILASSFQRDINIDSIRIGLIFKDQCNFQISSEELNLLNSLGVPLAISCYEDDLSDGDRAIQ